MTTRWVRVVRGWVAAVVAIALAAASHLAAGGAAPTLFGLAVALIIAGTVCTVLTARTLSLWRLGLGVGVSQVLFHTIFSGLGTPAATAHAHGTSELLGMETQHSTMWAAHAIAGLVTVVALRYGEVAFWGLGVTARLLFVRVFAPIVPVPITSARLAAPVERMFVPLGATAILSSMRHRGPPVEFAA